MKILFTGGSSFTGYWFVRQLAEAGHEVTATFTRDSVAAYGNDVRGKRVVDMQTYCTPVWSTAFGDDRFLALVGNGFDALCHHAADVTNYKSIDFDAVGATANNTRNARKVCEAFKAGGGSKFVVTNSVFAGGQGAGSDGLPHFSPYGLSKALSCETLRYYASLSGLHVGEFLIPNPFGPWEEPRFTNYLVKTWFAGKQAGCNTPLYVRDNIHVELLARAYAQFTGTLSQPYEKLAPCGYIESQGAFAQRFAMEMRPRLGLACELTLAEQTDFSEPRVRISTDVVDTKALGFDERAAWDAVASYYRGLYGS